MRNLAASLPLAAIGGDRYWTEPWILTSVTAVLGTSCPESQTQTHTHIHNEPWGEGEPYPSVRPMKTSGFCTPPQLVLPSLVQGHPSQNPGEGHGPQTPGMQVQTSITPDIGWEWGTWACLTKQRLKEHIQRWLRHKCQEIIRASAKRRQTHQHPLTAGSAEGVVVCERVAGEGESWGKGSSAASEDVIRFRSCIPRLMTSDDRGIALLPAHPYSSSAC